MNQQETPVQTAQAARTKLRERMRSRRSGLNVTQPKIATKERIASDKLREKLIKNYYSRKALLGVPDEIYSANPDKHFVWVNYNKLQKNGMYHPEGYRVYKTAEDSGNQHGEKFNESPDGLVHRNEMVLAYIPKEEFKMRELERQVVRGTRDLSSVIKNSPELLQDFGPEGDEERVSNAVDPAEVGE